MQKSNGDTRANFPSFLPKNRDVSEFRNTKGTVLSKLQGLGLPSKSVFERGQRVLLGQVWHALCLQAPSHKKEVWMCLVMMAINPADNVKYYFCDKCLPFGSSVSCSHFQHFSNCIAYLVQIQKEEQQLSGWLFVCCLDQSSVWWTKWTYFNLCKAVNFPVTIEIVFLGMILNTITQTILIPKDKTEKAVALRIWSCMHLLWGFWNGQKGWQRKE